MKPIARTVEAVDVELGGNRTLRIAVERESESGEAERLLLATGFGTGNEWRENERESFAVPAAALPKIAKALEALNDGE